MACSWVGGVKEDDRLLLLEWRQDATRWIPCGKVLPLSDGWEKLPMPRIATKAKSKYWVFLLNRNRMFLKYLSS